MPLKKNNYILDVGASAAPRLQNLHRFYSLHTLKLCSPYLKQAKSILDAGCGTGNVTRCFAENTSDKASVLGVDISSEQIDIAKKLSTSISENKLHFQTLDLVSNTLSQRFDLIYCRYTLIHISELKAAFKKLVSMLAPGGHLICKEPIMSTAKCKPFSQAYNYSRALIAQLAKQQGFDFDLGLRLENYAREQKLNVVDCKSSELTLKDKISRELVVMLLLESSQKILENEFIEEEAFNHLIDELRKLIKDDKHTFFFPKTVQLVAKKMAA